MLCILYCGWNGWVYLKLLLSALICLLHSVLQQKNNASLLTLEFLIAQFILFKHFLLLLIFFSPPPSLPNYCALIFCHSRAHLMSSCVPWVAGCLGFSVITAVRRELSFAWQMVQHHAASGIRDNRLPPCS